MCIDYRDVNAKTIKNAYPAPSLNSILDGLREAQYISRIDLKQAFLQVPIEENSKKYTDFSVEGSGPWQFTNTLRFDWQPGYVLQAGQFAVGTKGLVHVFAYLDDILFVTDTFEEHLKWLEYVLNKLVDTGLR